MTTSSQVQSEHRIIQWNVRGCELWDLSWHDLLEHLPTPSAFVIPSLPSIVVLNTPCGNMRSNLFTGKSNTGIVRVCSAFGRKSKCVLSFKKKKKLFLFFWLSWLILHFIPRFSPSLATRSPRSWFPSGGATAPFLSSGSATHCAQEGWLKDRHSEIFAQIVHSAIPRFPCKSC